MLFCRIDRGQKNDRCVAGPIALADQGGRVETVDRRHIHIQKNEREFLMEQEAQRLQSRGGADKVLSEIAQQGFKREKILGVIIDEEDIDLFAGHAILR